MKSYSEEQKSEIEAFKGPSVHWSWAPLKHRDPSFLLHVHQQLDQVHLRKEFSLPAWNDEMSTINIYVHIKKGLIPG